jgi:hypothetical protein
MATTSTTRIHCALSASLATLGQLYQGDHIISGSSPCRYGKGEHAVRTQRADESARRLSEGFTNYVYNRRGDAAQTSRQVIAKEVKIPIFVLLGLLSYVLPPSLASPSLVGDSFVGRLEGLGHYPRVQSEPGRFVYIQSEALKGFGVAYSPAYVCGRFSESEHPYRGRGVEHYILPRVLTLSNEKYTVFDDITPPLGEDPDEVTGQAYPWDCVASHSVQSSHGGPL